MPRGSKIYEDNSVRRLYVAHHHSGARSPIVVMEELPLSPRLAR